MKNEKNIYQRKNAVMKKVEKLAKDLAVDYKDTHYRGVSEAEVLLKVRPILIEEGIDISVIDAKQLESGNANRMRILYKIRWTNIDNPDDYIDTIAIGDGMDKGDKAPGKANTYALKYNIMKNLLMVSGDDPDVESSEELIDKMKQDLLTKEESKKFVSILEKYNITNREAIEALTMVGIEGKIHKTQFKEINFGSADIPSKIRDAFMEFQREI